MNDGVRQARPEVSALLPCLAAVVVRRSRSDGDGDEDEDDDEGEGGEEGRRKSEGRSEHGFEK